MNEVIEHALRILTAIDVVAKKHDPNPPFIRELNRILVDPQEQLDQQIMTPVNIADRVYSLVFRDREFGPLGPCRARSLE